MTTITPLEILLVEDNPGDIRLTREVMKDWKVMNQLNEVMDGVDAMAYLRNEGKFKDATRPDLVLLDLNLPRKNGREVLEEMKEDPDLKRIPVVVLTTSKSEQDILKSYNLHANCYITKPVDFEQFSSVVRAVEDFWFTVVKLPPRGER